VCSAFRIAGIEEVDFWRGNLGDPHGPWEMVPLGKTQVPTDGAQKAQAPGTPTMNSL
jgi:hypothetical protein